MSHASVQRTIHPASSAAPAVHSRTSPSPSGATVDSNRCGAVLPPYPESPPPRRSANMAAGLPDDLVLEYDMLQLVDGDDGGSFHADAAASVEELLASCSVGVSIATADEASTCASSASASGGAGCSSATVAKSPELAETITPTPDEFAAFLLDGEQFLRDMEKVVKLDAEGDNQKNQTALERNDGAIDLDAFSGLDVLPSPCPSAPSTADGSPCRNDADEFEIDCPLLADEHKRMEQEQARRYHEALMGHVLPPMSPPRLLHTDSTLSTTSKLSDVSSLGHTDGSVAASPMPAMPEETDKEPELSETHEEEDEEMDEEAMEVRQWSSLKGKKEEIVNVCLLLGALLLSRTRWTCWRRRPSIWMRRETS
ncbi:unnamed protein product [Phytophthora fragariaefolia]|uniref:Unnamed protein product n=1 Tax=Phytophthora fragariaefolia TaxID=1490495 RepID=A0A9W6XRQ0_9STRA|nr:unnamed protein product [Phytophthora fragariaefolia]